MQQFEKQDAPFLSSLEEALAKCNVQRQAYHSGSFVGNHVQRCLQVSYACVMAKLIKISTQQSGFIYTT